MGPFPSLENSNYIALADNVVKFCQFKYKAILFDDPSYPGYYRLNLMNKTLVINQNTKDAFIAALQWSETQKSIYILDTHGTKIRSDESVHYVENNGTSIKRTIKSCSIFENTDSFLLDLKNRIEI
jgi:hypothetical protein